MRETVIVGRRRVMGEEKRDGDQSGASRPQNAATFLHHQPGLRHMFQNLRAKHAVKFIVCEDETIGRTLDDARIGWVLVAANILRATPLEEACVGLAAATDVQDAPLPLLGKAMLHFCLQSVQH
jgi:hypothetical protein